jgi:adenylyl-sulfate kinase
MDRAVVWHAGQVTGDERTLLLKQKPATLWLTGLSGAGKSTVACALERRLLNRGHAAYVLDGDNVRHGLNRDLGFSPQDRAENIRRIAEVARLLNDAGLIVITAFISPYREDRETARSIVGSAGFLEVHVNTPLQVCEERDPKGFYRLARAGEIQSFTGISAPYEPPPDPVCSIDTAVNSVDECVDLLMGLLEPFTAMP